LTSVLPVAAVLIVLGLVFRVDQIWAFVIVGITLTLVLRIRQLLVLGDEHVEVTVLRTRRIPWSQIEGFEAGSSIRGGTVIRTSEGDVWSVSPCSWWGGPADQQDLDTLQRMLTSRGRRRR
jgi:hypothetical protein